MPTLTVRNLSPAVVRTLKSLAKRNSRSMELEVREILQEYTDRRAVLDDIEAYWRRQSRPTRRKEIDEWIAAGRG